MWFRVFLPKNYLKNAFKTHFFLKKSVFFFFLSEKKPLYVLLVIAYKNKFC